MDGAAQNTDRELWRGPDEGNGSFYADSIHVTVGGGIGINCGGLVIVKPLRDWHALACPWQPMETCPNSPELILIRVDDRRAPYVSRADDWHCKAAHWLEKAAGWMRIPPPAAISSRISILEGE